MSTSAGGPSTPGRCHRVGLAVDDFHGALEQWQRVFGAGMMVEPTHDPVAQCEQAVVWMGDAPVLALAPSDPDGVVGRWLTKNGPGVHSLAWEVANLDAAQERVRSAGIGITGVHDAQHYFFLHPRDTFGLLLELSDGHIDHDPRTGGTPIGGGGGLVPVARVADVTAEVPDVAPVAALLEQVFGATRRGAADFDIGDLTLRLVESSDPTARWHAALGRARRRSRRRPCCSGRRGHPRGTLRARLPLARPSRHVRHPSRTGGGNVSRSLEGMVALVTGASEGGTGRSTAVRFAAEGAKVAITAPNEDGLLETLAMIEDVGSTGLVMPADFGDRDGVWRTLIERTEAQLGPIDVLVNNAVTALMQPVEMWTLEELELTQQINVWVPWMLMTQVLPGMRERGRGWILNLTSSAGELPPGPPYGAIAKMGYAGYGANKAAINRLTTAAAAETEDEPIAVNALSPQITIGTPSVMAGRVMEEILGTDDVSYTLEPPAAMAEAALALCTGDPMVLTGRIAFSLQLLLELERPVYDIRGEELMPGVQPADLPEKLRRQFAFQREYGGPDVTTFNRPSTPLPEVLRGA